MQKSKARCTTLKLTFERFFKGHLIQLSLLSLGTEIKSGYNWSDKQASSFAALCISFLFWVIFNLHFYKEKLVDLKLFSSWAVTSFLEILRRLTAITKPIWPLSFLIPLRSTHGWNGPILIKLIWERLRHYFWGCTHFLHNKGNLLGEKWAHLGTN